jgi:hypothetical protein
MAKIMLVTGMMVGFAYSMEFFIAWYGANHFELVCVHQPGDGGRTGGRTGR